MQRDQAYFLGAALYLPDIARVQPGALAKFFLRLAAGFPVGAYGVAQRRIDVGFN